MPLGLGSWFPEPFEFPTESAIVGKVDWLIEEMMMSCEQRIARRFYLPTDLPPLHHVPRRARNIWDAIDDESPYH